MDHRIPNITASDEPSLEWEGPLWREVRSLRVDHFHPRSTNHHPETRVKFASSGDAIHLLFRVSDRYVRSVTTRFQDRVCEDSCVELFLQPRGTGGYFNFEFNCGGVLMLYFIEDPTREGTAFRKYTEVSPALASLISVRATMPQQTPIEIPEPIEWRLGVTIPLAVMEPFVGRLTTKPGEAWRGNLFKCGSGTSHPHWASWSPIGDELNFHQPARFGTFTFE